MEDVWSVSICVQSWSCVGTAVVTDQLSRRRLVAKVTHKDLTARIRSMQVVYANGEDVLPWIVLATSTGTVQVWDLASFHLDSLAPEESNASTEPVATTTIISKPRITCLTACIASETVAPTGSADDQQAKQQVRKKGKSKKSSGSSSASAPRVVVELDTEAGQEDAGEATSTSESSKKRKTNGNQQQQQQPGQGKRKKSKKTAGKAKN